MNLNFELLENFTTSWFGLTFNSAPSKLNDHEKAKTVESQPLIAFKCSIVAIARGHFRKFEPSQ